MPGVQRARSLGWEKSRTTPSVVTTVTPDSPGIPRAMPPIGLFCHRRLTNIGWSAPGRADFASARLDTSVEMSGPHDFAVRESIVRQRAVDNSRETRPAVTCRA